MLFGGNVRRISVVIAVLFALCIINITANAAVTCTPGAGTVTCTGGPGASINVTSNGSTQAGTPFPSTIAVTGGGSGVKSVSLTLHGYTSVVGPVNGTSIVGSRDMGLLLVGPDGTNFELLRCVGVNFANGSFQPTNNITVTLQAGS